MNTQHEPVSLYEFVTRPHLLATGLRLLGQHLSSWLRSKSGWWYAAIVFALLVTAGIGYCLYMAVTGAMVTSLPPERQAFGIALLVVVVVAAAVFAIGLRRNPNEPQ